MDIKLLNGLLEKVSLINKDYWVLFFRSITDKVLVECSEEFKGNLQKRKVDISLNLFTLISEFYHYENFHSDILKVLLDPNGGHDARNKYLNIFLTLLKKKGAKIKLNDFCNCKIEREKGNIDLAILDDISKQAIIIENKINNAPDMNRQLPRYLEYIAERGFSCSTIVYLTLNKNKNIDTTDWTAEEYSSVKGKLISLVAYDETENDMHNGWLLPAIQLTSNIDALLILRQYSSLIKKLGGNVMNTIIVEKFYKEMLDEEKFSLVLSLQSMLDDLILYRVQNIIKRFQNDTNPFEKVSNHKDVDAFFTPLYYDKSNFSIDIIVEKSQYEFQFWDRNYEGSSENPALKMLEIMQYFDGFSQNGNRMTKIFSFPKQEEELFEFIKNFKNRLNDAISKK